ncbi:hypothetical protein [Desulfoluna spongiiphila]|uniref:Flagellar protein FliL n=1 Tax=Desulfoluna spongiiphila TaxID=419481 RepID=A0A1G5AJH3_9BACT|nr:hypothetical protein [Desulfoluna spongiiphila]SCX78037.1 hypothetical protein SAMN05216233_101237 [Desulfoluna spongiiphila]VVS90535.1 consensus disorder prediction [Desulfoluna spongiiphila]
MSLPDSSPYADNFVSQDQIDTLLKGRGDYAFPDGEDPLGDIADFINTDEIDRLLSDDEPEGVPKSNREDEMTDELLPEDDGLEDEDLSMISMDDIQRVLSEDDPEAPEEASLDELSLDEIAGEPQGEPAESEEDLISQDDIDRLLKNSGVDAEEPAKEEEDGFQISDEEIETILTDTLEDPPRTRADETVVPDSEVPAEAMDEAPSEEPSGGKKKRVLIAAGVVLFFLLGGGAGWFFLKGGDDPSVPVDQLVDSMGLEQTAVPADAGATGEPQVVSRLENFLIPAADGNDYAFVATHVVLTIRGVKRDPLAGYETFYRKRIYDELAARLATVSGEKPVERELRELVRKTAGALLTEGVIDKVVLEDYRLM